jgi:hypothetical protein
MLYYLFVSTNSVEYSSVCMYVCMYACSMLIVFEILKTGLTYFRYPPFGISYTT